MKKNNNSAWLEGKSWHRIRDEMLLSPAWKAATHLQRSMVSVLLTELGRHGGKNNGDLIFTNRNFQEFGFSRDAIKPNLAAIEALGLYAYKRGRPGLRGYGNARRGRMTFMPILDADGNEIEPPTDEWARFSTTKEAKMAAKTAYKRAQSSNFRSRNRTTTRVVQKSDHLTAKHNRQSNAEKPMEVGLAVSEIGPLSTSEEANHVSSTRGVGEVEQHRLVPAPTLPSLFRLRSQLMTTTRLPYCAVRPPRVRCGAPSFSRPADRLIEQAAPRADIPPPLARAGIDQGQQPAHASPWANGLIPFSLTY